MPHTVEMIFENVEKDLLKVSFGGLDSRKCLRVSMSQQQFYISNTWLPGRKNVGVRGKEMGLEKKVQGKEDQMAEGFDCELW